MITHPDLVVAISAADYQQRLRDAEQARIAASAQASARSPLTVSETTNRRPLSWLARILLRPRSAKRAQPTDPAAERKLTMPSANRV